MKLQTLYKTSATGATQILNMTINGAVYTRIWGQLNGKMQYKATTAIGKNIGKANETTPEAQALLEAEAVWTKKQKANYSTSQAAPVTVKLPMKVNEYQKHLKKIAAKVYTSPKLNGVNAEYRLIGGVLKLLSRGGEEYPIPPHQHDEALALLKLLGTDSINGEQYIHGEFLQDIMAAVKKPNGLTPSLKFHVFDFPEVEGDYTTRCSTMYAKNDASTVSTPNFPFVPVWVANSPEEIDDQYEQCMAAGYEGLIVRNPTGLYEYNKRSLNVFKYKIAQDAEFESISFKLDKNSHPVFTCYVDPTKPISKENTFDVKLKGTAEARTAMGLIAEDLLGQYIKVEFEMLSKVGKPQKPVGIMFRAVDANGEAVE